MSQRNPKPRYFVGERIGKRTVISVGPDFPSGGHRWFLRCDCGRETLCGVSEIVKMRRCLKCTPKYEDLTGQVFDKRTVLSVAVEDKYKHKIRWNVRCECGNEFTCLLQALKIGGYCNNCTPKRGEPRPNKRKRPYEAQYNAWLGHARYPVNITYEQFLEFVKIQECHYCGAPINWMEHGLKGVKKSTASNLDRVDSTKPYDLDNVVVCCGRCNIGKNTLFSYEEWKEIGAVIRTWGAKDSPWLGNCDSRRESNWRKNEQEETCPQPR